MALSAVTRVETPSGVPSFRLLLPQGWEELPATRESIAQLTALSSAVFKSQHRPDLDSEFTRMMELATRRMKQAGVFAIYLQTTVPEDDVLPLSMSASIVRGRLGGTLDREVSSLFRDRGAAFLSDNHQIVRWTADTVHDGEFTGTSSRVIDYLIPVPGAGRRTALQFTTTLVHPTGDDEASELVDQMAQLSDVIVSTFSWEGAPA
ncbi:hypothetical protein [Glaciihabitans sp. UYNi722]|uniref:hypothetical protein n=1 Tax=Glaciihabitans sp. UYNi722 TaxID=3156344 RepID=UPI003391FD18